MHSWLASFDDHDLWAKIGALREKASEVITDTPSDADSLEYVIALVDMIDNRREKTDPLLVTPSMLQDVANGIDQLSSTIDNWTSGAYTYGQVDSAVQAVITTFAAWPAPSPTAVATIFTANARRLGEVTDGVIEEVEQRRAELEEEVASLKSDLDALKKTAEEQQGELNNAIVGFVKSYGETIDTATQEWAKAREEQEAAGGAILETLETKEKEARDLVSAATGSVVATDYQKYAQNKAFAGWVCDVGAALLGAAGAGALLFHLFSAQAASDGDVGLSLTRLAASIGTLGVAALVAKRGSEHHREARAAKRTDLAVRQVRPFIETLPEDIREKVILEVTERVFIRGELSDDAGNSEGPSLLEKLTRGQGNAQDTVGG